MEKMKTRNFAEIGFKLLGIYSAFQFIATLPTAFTVAQSKQYFENSTGEIEEVYLEYFARLVLSTNLSCIFYLLMAIILPLGASAFAQWLVKYNGSDAGELNISSEGVIRFLLQLAGIYALITWLPNFAQTLIRTVIYGSWQNPQVPTLQRFYENWSVITAPALGTALGLFLLFRVNGMIRIIRLARPMEDGT